MCSDFRDAIFLHTFEAIAPSAISGLQGHQGTGKRGKGQRVGGICDPSLEEAHIPSAHVSLAGISHMPPPNCKGGWEMWSS